MTDALREANLRRAKAIFENFAPMDPEWIAGLHPDLAMEFPFGAGVGLPPRIEGKEQGAGLFQLVAAKLGLKFSDVAVEGMADPNRVIVTYKGAGGLNGKAYNQTYLTLLEFRDDKLVLYREYVDTQIVAEAFGHLSAIV